MNVDMLLRPIWTCSGELPALIQIAFAGALQRRLDTLTGEELSSSSLTTFSPAPLILY